MVAAFLTAEVTSEGYGPQIRDILARLGQTGLPAVAARRTGSRARRHGQPSQQVEPSNAIPGLQKWSQVDARDAPGGPPQLSPVGSTHPRATLRGGPSARTAEQLPGGVPDWSHDLASRGDRGLQWKANAWIP